MLWEDEALAAHVAPSRPASTKADRTPPSFGKALLGKHEANSPLERFVSLMTMRSAPYNQRSHRGVLLHHAAAKHILTDPDIGQSGCAAAA